MRLLTPSRKKLADVCFIVSKVPCIIPVASLRALNIVNRVMNGSDPKIQNTQLLRRTKRRYYGKTPRNAGSMTMQGNVVNT